MPEPTQIGALIPAAGLSRRMGRAKPLLPLGGSDFLGCILETLRRHAPAVEPVVVIRRQGDHALARRLDQVAGQVAGLVAGQVAGQVAGMWLSVATVADGPGDMLGSVREGEPLLGDAAGALVWPVDVPCVAGATVEKVHGAALLQPDRVVLPLSGGQTGHPAYVPRSLLRPTASSGEGSGLRGVLAAARAPAVEVVVEDRFSLLNVNTPQDYKLLQGWLHQSGPTV